jgi:hypothetical protein
MTGRIGQGDLQYKQQQCASERDVAMTGRASPNDRTRLIACDRTRRASDQLFVMHCANGCPTGRAGSARDRTRRSATLSRARLPVVWTDRTWQPRPVTSTTAFGYCFSVRNILDFRHLFSPPTQWKIDISFSRKHLNLTLASSAGGREDPKPLSTAQTPPPS